MCICSNFSRRACVLIFGLRAFMKAMDILAGDHRQRFLVSAHSVLTCIIRFESPWVLLCPRTITFASEAWPEQVSVSLGAPQMPTNLQSRIDMFIPSFRGPFLGSRFGPKSGVSHCCPQMFWKQICDNFFSFWYGRSRSKARSSHVKKQFDKIYIDICGHVAWQIKTEQNTKTTRQGETQIRQPDMRFAIQQRSKAKSERGRAQQEHPRTKIYHGHSGIKPPLSQLKIIHQTNWFPLVRWNTRC